MIKFNKSSFTIQLLNIFHIQTGKQNWKIISKKENVNMSDGSKIEEKHKKDNEYGRAQK